MTLDKAIAILRDNYKKALRLGYVKRPLAWALYKTWREVDKHEHSPQ